MGKPPKTVVIVGELLPLQTNECVAALNLLARAGPDYDQGLEWEE